MENLLESNEFGDWLIVEISASESQPEFVAPGVSRNACRRLQDLKTARKVLFEFLLIQQQMLNAAHACRPQHP